MFGAFFKPLRTPWAGFLGLIVATGALAAEPKFDMYVCATLSGQGQVMGSGAKIPAPSGVYRSTDRKNFEHLGFSHIRVFHVTADPSDPSALFLSVLDGVIRATDGGKKWRRVTSWDMTEPKGLAFDPNAPGTAYVGLPDGIAKSTDGGQTWARSQTGIQRGYTHPILVDRTKVGRVLAGTELGIYLSQDGGKTWLRTLPTEKTVYDIRQSPHNPKDFLAVTSSNGAFRSSDGGGTWVQIESVPREFTLHNCDFDRNDPNRLVISGWGLGVLVSEDNGRSWVDRSAGLPKKELWRSCTDPDFPGRLYAVPHLLPLHVSDDFGKTWRPLAFEQTIAFDIAFLPRVGGAK